MAFRAGGDLWKPKKTLRDWGRTEYRIVRNWTPRELREARSKAPPPSLAKVSHSSRREEEEDDDNGQDFSLIQDQDIEQERDEEEEPAVDTSSQSSLLSIQQRRDSQSGSPDQISEGEGSVSRRIAPHQSESRRGGLSGSSNRLRDWGRTEYRIERNWTPRELREARNKAPPPSLAKVSHSSRREEEEEEEEENNGSGFSLIQDQDIEQEGDEEEALIEPAVDKSSQSSLQQWRDSQNGSPDQISEGEGSVSRRIAPHQNESRRGGPSGSSNRSGARRVSGAGRVSMLERGNEGGASLASSPPGGSLSGGGDQSPRREEEPSEESQLSSEELKESLSPPAKRTTPTPSKGKKRGAPVSKGKGSKARKKTEGRVKVKLWRPRKAKRTGRDLHELDICLTVYDKIIREELEGAESLPMERLLANHWKHTQKQMLGLIRDVHTVKALNKILQKEKGKHRQLQNYHLSALKALRRTNGGYNKALGKAKQARKREELSVQADEIERLAQELKPYFEQYHI